MRFQCINTFRDRSRGRYVNPGESVEIDSQAEIQRLTLANCIRPLPEGPRRTPSTPPADPPQGPAVTPEVETASVEIPEREAQTGRRRGRKKSK